MDILLDILFVAGFIIGLALIIFLICISAVAALYESIFGKRFEIYDSCMLPDMKSYQKILSEPVTFPSKRGYNYTGSYYYDEKYSKFKGLVVFSHGIFQGHINYMPKIAYFAERGYKVFAYDNSGCHLSGGKTMRGLPQSAEDLDMALHYITQTNKLPLFLFGHSWGGYAVSAVSCYSVYDIKGIFVQSGFNKTTEMLLEEGARRFGRWIYAYVPYISMYERLKYGKSARYTAEKGIAKATANGTKVLILHSTDDKTISLAHSVLANVERNQNITLVTRKDKGHNSLDSDRSIKYREKLDDEFYAQYGGNATDKKRREYFMEKADAKIYYELDYKLMKLVLDFYDTAL